MPVIQDAELPIVRTRLSGLGINQYENRKETGSKVEVTTAELRKNYDKVKALLLHGLKQLAHIKL